MALLFSRQPGRGVTILDPFAPAAHLRLRVKGSFGRPIVAIP
jgi:hypothetical protein